MHGQQSQLTHLQQPHLQQIIIIIETKTMCVIHKIAIKVPVEIELDDSILVFHIISIDKLILSVFSDEILLIFVFTFDGISVIVEIQL